MRYAEQMMMGVRRLVRVMSVATVVASAATLAGCVVAPREGVHTGSPLDAAAASGLAVHELAKEKPNEVVFGWKLEVAGERARFFECTAEDTCGDKLVEVPAESVLAVRSVGRARPTRDDGTSGEETDVLRLTLTKDVHTSRGGVASDPNRGLTFGGAQSDRPAASDGNARSRRPSQP